MRKELKILYASLLLILFLGYYGSITLFYHSHVVLGDTIVHSHPYKSDISGKPTHSHSEKGFISIQLINTFISLSAVIYFCFIATSPIICKIPVIAIQGKIICITKCHNSLRAPPEGFII